jgi:iron only hydrogenase large subunit-like protein
MMLLAKAGKRDGYLLEGMGCPGGCVAGAGTITPVKDAAAAVSRYMAAASVQCAMDSPLKSRLQDLED